MRRKAYDFSHAKLSERRIKILKLYAAGSTQAEIARQLGVSRQAVSKSLFKLRGYFNTWGEISLKSLIK
ncbi:helix-turn-helix domain-containing protein [Vreelandella boliviensis]|uniref:helix-turn-helix domain-containing protein n=1 Tax=Vreelandella boliviensis TaxID=223527 RepID=UPI0035300A8F